MLEFPSIQIYSFKERWTNRKVSSVFLSSSMLNVIMQKIKCRGPVLPLHCGRCGLHLCLIFHPCALHLPSAFETRSGTSSRTRELSFHGTPSFQLLIRAEAQCRAAFADCCRPAQHLASSWPRGGSDTPSSLFSLKDTIETICVSSLALLHLTLPFLFATLRVAFCADTARGCF